MYHLNDLQLAIRIADLQSVSAAGRELGMTPAAASAALQRLEKSSIACCSPVPLGR